MRPVFLSVLSAGCLAVCGCAMRANAPAAAGAGVRPGVLLNPEPSPTTFDPFEDGGEAAVTDLQEDFPPAPPTGRHVRHTVMAGYSRNERQEFDIAFDFVPRETREEVFVAYQVGHPVGLLNLDVDWSVFMPWVITEFEFQNQSRGPGDLELAAQLRTPGWAVFSGWGDTSPRVRAMLRGAITLGTGDNTKGTGTGKDGTGYGGTVALTQRLGTRLLLDAGVSFFTAKTPGQAQGLSRPQSTTAIFAGINYPGIGRFGVTYIDSESLFVLDTIGTFRESVTGYHFSATYTEHSPYVVIVTWSYDRKPASAQGVGLSFGVHF